MVEENKKSEGMDDCKLEEEKVAKKEENLKNKVEQESNDNQNDFTGKDSEREEKSENEKKDLDDFENKYIRLSADFQNYKKRIEKEKSEIFKSANTRLITDMLPLIDDFDRAIEHAADSSKEAFADGIELIIKRFAEILVKEGLEYIDTTDAMFDPGLHHAVMMEKVDGEESGKILMEMQKGYKVNGKVIRPSMVKVAE